MRWTTGIIAAIVPVTGMDRHHKLQIIAAGYLAATAVMGYFAAPVLRFAPSTDLLVAGCLALVGITSAWTALVEGWGILAAAVALLILISAIAFCGFVVERAGQTAVRIDGQCAIIQRAMLYPHKRTRTDLPDVFQALGCRPQPI